MTRHDDTQTGGADPTLREAALVAENERLKRECQWLDLCVRRNQGTIRRLRSEKAELSKQLRAGARRLEQTNPEQAA